MNARYVISHTINILLYGTGPVVLGYLSGHLVAGCGIALFTIISLYALEIRSRAEGAKYALQHLPNPGEIFISFTAFDREIPLTENFLFKLPEVDTDENQMVAKSFSINKGGRKRGSLSSGRLPVGTTIEGVLPFLRDAKKAFDRHDGTFAEICRQRGIPESTVRDWIKRYSDMLERN